jgi:branched-chain amino acid transport system substrate-binding protein
MRQRMISAGNALRGAVMMLACFVFGGLVLVAAPLKIGMMAPFTGLGAESGRYLGRQIELVIEDDQTTEVGVMVAFRKLAEDKDIPAFIGPIRSIQIHAIARDIQKLGKPVMIGGTDPQLTHMGNPWLFRCRPNDIYSTRVMADYGVKALGKKKWVIVYSLDAFGTNAMKNLVEVLKGMGIEPELLRGYTNNWQDSTPVAIAVQRSGANVMGTYMTFESDLGVFAKQLQQLGVHITWVGSASMVATTALTLAGSALYGSFAIVDFSPDSSTAAKEFAAKYETAYGSAPDVFASWAYDAVHVLALAINNAKSLDAEKIRQAVLSVKGYAGAKGTYNFDQNGDGLHGYNIVRNDNGTIVFEKHIEFND